MRRLLQRRGTWIVLGVLVLVTATAAAAWSTLRVGEEAYDPEASEQIVDAIPDDVRTRIADAVDETEAAEATIPEEASTPLDPYELPSTDNPATVSPPLPDDMFESYLLIGTDASGRRADVIIYVLVPTDGGDPILTSLPRDLYMENPCTERYTRINATLNGCGDFLTGTSLLSLAVERFTGVAVDAFALVDFDGFEDIVDAVGGVEACFDYPTRDDDAGLSVPAGCQLLDGESALAWARSRKTLELRDGAWRGVGADDFSRQAHQQELLFALADRVASFSSITKLADIAEATSAAVRLSEGFSLSQAVGLAWEYRTIDPDTVPRIRLETKPYVTDAGAYVLEPTRSFNELLAEVYPDAYRPVVAAGG